MGCCGSTDAGGYPQGPMDGGQRVGTVGGAAVSREEQRARAAAAAESRAQSQGTRGQQGTRSKMRPVAAQRPEVEGSNPLADPRNWD